MIENKTKKTTLASKVKLCNTSWSMGKGLMFSTPIVDKGLVFEFKKLRKVSFHMFFVFYPIDILFLDEKNVVVEQKENFKPFTVYNTKQRVKYAIELPLGTINKSKTGVWDVVNF